MLGTCNKTVQNNNRDSLKMYEVIFGSSPPEHKKSVLFCLVIIACILPETLDLGCNPNNELKLDVFPFFFQKFSLMTC